MQMIGMNDVAEQFPGRGGRERMHPSAILRWVTEGLKMPDGSRLRLRARRVGMKWMTSQEWLDEFLDTYTRASLPLTADVEIRTPTAARAASIAAGEALAAAGA